MTIEELRNLNQVFPVVLFVNKWSSFRQSGQFKLQLFSLLIKDKIHKMRDREIEMQLMLRDKRDI